MLKTLSGLTLQVEWARAVEWFPLTRTLVLAVVPGPVMYMEHTDVKNDGSNITDLMIGSANWAPNWDPGIQSLHSGRRPLFPVVHHFRPGCCERLYGGTSSGGCFGHDGCHRNFQLECVDLKRPVISFYGGTYSLHNEGFDDVCFHYTNDIKIIECSLSAAGSYDAYQ